MKVKLTNPDLAVGLIDPHTKRSPFIDPTTGAVIETADVPDSTFWNRRLTAREIQRVEDQPDQPTGREPVAPLTTR